MIAGAAERRRQRRWPTTSWNPASGSRGRAPRCLPSSPIPPISRAHAAPRCGCASSRPASTLAAGAVLDLPHRVARDPAALARVHPRVRSALSVRRRAGARALGALGASPPLPRGGRRHLDRGSADLPTAAGTARHGWLTPSRWSARSARCGRTASAGSAELLAPVASAGPVEVTPPPPDELGAHMSIAGGLHLALERGQALGCFAVQIFVKNQRQWAARPLGDDEVRAFRAARRSTGIPAGLRSRELPDQPRQPRSGRVGARGGRFFTDELERAEALGLACVAIHPGSHLGAGIEAGLDRVASGRPARCCAARAGYRVRVALENTAGGGGTRGPHVRRAGRAAHRDCRARGGSACVWTPATCSPPATTSARPPAIDAAMDECAREVGMSRVLAFHLNDARGAAGLRSRPPRAHRPGPARAAGPSGSC